jgi:exopolysaccharide biosynthesis polyprenyl glycosylphosphotransferase
MMTLDGPWLNDDVEQLGVEATSPLSATSETAGPSSAKLTSMPAASVKASTLAGGRGHRRLRHMLVAIDLFAAAIAAGTVVALSKVDTSPASGIPRVVMAIVLLVAVAIAVTAAQGLYRARVCAVKSQELVGVARTALAVGVVASLMGNALRAPVSPGVAILAGLIVLLTMSTGRAAFSGWLRVCRATGRFTRDVVIVGINDETLDLISLIQARPELGYRIKGLIGDEALDSRVGDIPLLGDLATATDAFVMSGAPGAIVLTSALTPCQINEIVRDLLDAGAHVQLGSGLSRFGHRRLRPQPLSHETLFYVERVNFSQAKLVGKRALDIVLSTVLIAITAPIMIAASVAIKLGDKGPVLFRQERTGKGRQPFMLLKLRTMVPDASAKLHELVGSNERQGPLFKLAADPRVTRIGGILRATSIDELPQLFNVLGGSMSLVGPRPALGHELANFDDELRAAKMAVPPGITGLWQVEARDNPSFVAYRNLDLFYIENWSMTLDLAILAATAPVVIGRGLRPLIRRFRGSTPPDSVTPSPTGEPADAIGQGAVPSGGRDPVLDLRDSAASVAAHAPTEEPEEVEPGSDDDLSVSAEGSAA